MNLTPFFQNEKTFAKYSLLVCIYPVVNKAVCVCVCWLVGGCIDVRPP